MVGFHSSLPKKLSYERPARYLSLIMCIFHQFEAYVDLNIDFQLRNFNFEKVSVNMQAAKNRTYFLSCGDNGASFFLIDKFYFWFNQRLSFNLTREQSRFSVK
jgi:hypothetical protein